MWLYFDPILVCQICLGYFIEETIHCFSTYISSKGGNYNLLTYHRFCNGSSSPKVPQKNRKYIRKTSGQDTHFILQIITFLSYAQWKYILRQITVFEKKSATELFTLRKKQKLNLPTARLTAPAVVLPIGLWPEKGNITPMV